MSSARLFRLRISCCICCSRCCICMFSTVGTSRSEIWGGVTRMMATETNVSG